MDEELERHGQEAISRLEHVLDRGAEVEHAEIQAAVLSVVAFRDRVIEKHREGSASAACLSQANALLSLAYGGEFPLSGLHRHRFEQTRDGMRQLLRSE